MYLYIKLWCERKLLVVVLKFVVFSRLIELLQIIKFASIIQTLCIEYIYEQRECALN
jgi:hypothetical protein